MSIPRHHQSIRHEIYNFECAPGNRHSTPIVMPHAFNRMWQALCSASNCNSNSSSTTTSTTLPAASAPWAPPEPWLPRKAACPGFWHMVKIGNWMGLGFGSRVLGFGLLGSSRVHMSAVAYQLCIQARVNLHLQMHSTWTQSFVHFDEGFLICWAFLTRPTPFKASNPHHLPNLPGMLSAKTRPSEGVRPWSRWTRSRLRASYAACGDCERSEWGTERAAWSQGFLFKPMLLIEDHMIS